VDWQGAPFGKLQALPTNAEPIISKKWGCTDEAFLDVTKGIRSVVGSSNSASDNNRNGTNVNKNLKVIIVDQMHRGDYATISDAISAAPPGSRILVRSGVYDEGLVIDKPLEIEGDGNLGEVVIRAEGKDVILFRTARGIVSNLVLMQMGGGKSYCVDIQQGVLELSGCDITSESLSCVAIHGRAYPKLRGNKIHDGKNGILVYENGQGLIEDNDIFRNAYSGIEIKEAGNPIVRGNKIHDGCAGIGVWKSGQGLIEDNDIFRNAYSGIEIIGEGNPIVRGNKIHDGRQNGVYIHKDGQGLIENNDLFGNAYSGIEIKESGNPTVRGNRINRNSYYAASIRDNGAGTIENNDLRDNKNGAWFIEYSSMNTVKRSGNQE
jgi:F-box protein 11